MNEEQILDKFERRYQSEISNNQTEIAHFRQLLSDAFDELLYFPSSNLVKAIPNPYPTGETAFYNGGYAGFESCRQAVLKMLE